jgi:hypothetical protein
VRATVPDIPRILEDVLREELPATCGRVPVLAGMDVAVVVADDLPMLTESVYPVVLLRDADQVDEVVLNATESARTYEQAIAVAAFDRSEEILGSALVRALVTVVRTVLLGHPNLPTGLRVLEVGNADYGRAGHVGDVGPNGIAVSELTARLWCVESTVLAPETAPPVVTQTEVVVIPVPANQE